MPLVFPKPRMRISEIVALNIGFTKEELYRYAHMEGCESFVERTSNAKNSHIIFYTEDFAEWLKKRRCSTCK